MGVGSKRGTRRVERRRGSGEQKITLPKLKDASELSNKAWDKGIKGLTKQNLAKVSKTDDNLYVELVE